MRDSILFYRSFADAIKALPTEDQLAALWAVLDYGLDEIEPEGGIAKAIWLMAKPLIDNNNKRYENGKKGGRPKKENQTETKTKPKTKQSQSKKQPSQRELLESLLVGRAVSDKMREALIDWVDYKTKERRQTYKELGLKALITTAVNYGSKYGGDAVVGIIEKSIANQYEGIVWDWLDKKKGSKFNNAPTREYDMSDLEIRLLATN